MPKNEKWCLTVRYAHEDVVEVAVTPKVYREILGKLGEHGSHETINFESSAGIPCCLHHCSRILAVTGHPVADLSDILKRHESSVRPYGKGPGD